MTDNHDIVQFSLNGEKILGVVIEHYTNPLDDFYIVYAEYSICRFHRSDEDAEVMMENVIIPACDMAIAEYRLKMQHLKDMRIFHREMGNLMAASKSDVDSVFGDSDAE